MSALPHIIFTFPVSPGKVDRAVRLFRPPATPEEEAEFYTEDISPTAKKRAPIPLRYRVACPELLEMRFNANANLYEATVFYPILVQPVGATSLHYEIMKGGKDGMENKKICRFMDIYGVLNPMIWLSGKGKKAPWWYPSRLQPSLRCKFCGLPSRSIEFLHDGEKSCQYRFQIMDSKMGKHWGFVAEVTVPISGMDFYHLFSFVLNFPDDYDKSHEATGVVRAGRKTISFIPYEDVKRGEEWLSSRRKVLIQSAQ